jgi:hypothetical protein
MAEMGLNNLSDPLPSPAFTNNPPEHTLSSEEWKHRSPYYIPNPNEFGEIKWRGHCQCRKVSYSLRRESPLNAKFCHCLGCQRMHGAPFQWAAIFHKDDISFDKGSNGLSFFSASQNSNEYHTPTKVKCDYCGSFIMDEGRNTVLLFPSSIEFKGSLDEQRSQRDFFRPTYVPRSPDRALMIANRTLGAISFTSSA